MIRAMENFAPPIVVSLLVAILMMAPMSGNAYADLIPTFEDLAYNIVCERFVLAEPGDFQGEFHSAIDEFEIYYDLYEFNINLYDVHLSGPTLHIPAVDPQIAILFSEFNVNGENVTDALIDYALLPENVVFTQHLENFMGGSTLIGTSAFAGGLYDDAGNAIPNSDVGFGVFETISGEKFFTPIAFVYDITDLVDGASFVWDFDPVVPSSDSGTFTATGRGLVAYEEVVIPEPSTLLLLGVGSSVLLRRRREKTD